MVKKVEVKDGLLKILQGRKYPCAKSDSLDKLYENVLSLFTAKGLIALHKSIFGSSPKGMLRDEVFNTLSKSQADVLGPKFEQNMADILQDPSNRLKSPPLNNDRDANKWDEIEKLLSGGRPILPKDASTGKKAKAYRKVKSNAERCDLIRGVPVARGRGPITCAQVLGEYHDVKKELAAIS